MSKANNLINEISDFDKDQEFSSLRDRMRTLNLRHKTTSAFLKSLVDNSDYTDVEKIKNVRSMIKSTIEIYKTIDNVLKKLE